LLVRGEKRITINQGEEYIRLQGIVRPIDIGPRNTVPSTQIADAQIIYSGKGHQADSNHPGWLTRFFNSPWFPF
jgi:flagellar L-ring protein precursor FlgH